MLPNLALLQSWRWRNPNLATLDRVSTSLPILGQIARGVCYSDAPRASGSPLMTGLLFSAKAASEAASAASERVQSTGSG